MNPCLNLFKKNNIATPVPIEKPQPTPTMSSNTIPDVPINIWEDLKPLNLSKIQWYIYPENKYFKNEYQKKQIVLHHTVSGPHIDGDVNSWIRNKHNVGTTIIVDRDGTPWQLFSSKYWAYHLGIGTNSHYLDKHSIGIELDNWGGLTKGSGSLKFFKTKKYKLGKWNLNGTDTKKYYNDYGGVVDTPIQYYPEGFRGYYYFEKYTEKQIRTVGELLLLWRDRYGIPLTFNEDMFEFSSDAIDGKPGVWTHVSFRKDKSDCHPQPELIDMLKTIQNL